MLLLTVSRSVLIFTKFWFQKKKNLKFLSFKQFNYFEFLIKLNFTKQEEIELQQEEFFQMEQQQQQSQKEENTSYQEMKRNQELNAREFRLQQENNLQKELENISSEENDELKNIINKCEGTKLPSNFRDMVSKLKAMAQ